MGVASMAWKFLIHLMPAMTGYDASEKPSCMAWAASRPGARNVEIVDAVDLVRRSREPRPRPMAARYSTGLRNVENIEPATAACMRAPGSRRPAAPSSSPFGPCLPSRVSRYSTRLRPVRWRKTSSSVLRRTRAVSGTMPRSWTAVSAASPSFDVEQHPVGQHLDPVADPVEPVEQLLLHADREAELDAPPGE